MEYTFPVVFAQACELPLIGFGMEGPVAIVTDRHLEVPLPQELLAATQINPFEAAPLKSTKIFSVPAPLEILAPNGSIQEYEVAPGTELIEYETPNVLAQIVEAPEIGAGIAGGGSTVTKIELEIAVLQELLTIHA